MDSSKQYFEKSLLIGPHYAGWVKVSYARLLVRMQLFDEALTFTSKYTGSEFSSNASKNSIKLFRAYALAKTNDLKKAKTVVKNVLEQTEFNRKTFFERTLNSAKDSTFIADVKETLKKVGFE